MVITFNHPNFRSSVRWSAVAFTAFVVILHLNAAIYCWDVVLHHSLPTAFEHQAYQEQAKVMDYTMCIVVTLGLLLLPRHWKLLALLPLGAGIALELIRHL